jgi:molybdopterin synthase catalytic subunit
MDQLKQRVPIWKKEHYVDGREEWQHPGMGDVCDLSVEAGP